MKSLLTTICLAVLLTTGDRVHAGIINGGFESGFSGWTTLSFATIETSAFGANPTQGVRQALIKTRELVATGSSSSEVASALGITTTQLDSLAAATVFNGSAFYQTFSANAGDTLSFDWNFLTDEQTPVFYDDFGFWTLVNQNSGALLANTNSVFVDSPTPFSEETGYRTTTLTISTSGTYTLGFGIMNVGDDSHSSGLLVDNVSLSSISSVPEPASFAIWGLGAIGFYVVHRKKLSRS